MGKKRNKIYLVYLTMDEATLRRANEYGQYTDIMIDGKFVNDRWVILWAWTDRKSYLRAFLESRPVKNRYFIKEIELGDFNDVGLPDSTYKLWENLKRNEIFPCALETVYDIKTSSYCLKSPVIYKDDDREMTSTCKKVWMTGQEFDYIFDNSGEITQTRAETFINENADILPYDPRIFSSEVQEMLFDIGYSIDILTYHPYALPLMVQDDSLRILYNTYMKRDADGEIIPQYSDYKLFLITYRDIIY